MKRSLCIILLILIMLLAMTSCNQGSGSGEGSGEGDGTGSTDYGTATVYTQGMKVLVVPANGNKACSDFSYEFKDELESRGIFFERGTVYNQIEDYEILIGFKDPERPATLRAYELLERMEKHSYFDARYLVYADSGVISIAFDQNEYTNLTAIECITDQVLDAIFKDKDKDYVAHAQGVILSGEVDLIQAQEELDKIKSNEEWLALEREIAIRATANSGIENRVEAGKYGAELAKDIVSAFKAYRSMFGDDIVDWTANLYDPGIGAFYSSSSGRDGEEFGPDAENTVQLIRMLIASGMCDDISPSGDWKVLLPKEMQVRMVYFAKSIQNEDGYFYHPQWDITSLKQNSIRLSRDIGWCNSICTMLGFKPTYDTPRGVEGDGITADEFWEMYGIGEKPYTYDKSPTKDSLNLSGKTSSLGISLEYAVAQAVSVSEVAPAAAASDKYKSHQNYINFLTKDLMPMINSNPYSGGSTIGEAFAEVQTAANKLGPYTYTSADPEEYRKFDGMTLVEMTISELNAAINEKTGFWGNIISEKHTGTEFYYTNGFMKMMAAYNGFKIAYPEEYMATAAESLIAGLLGDEPSTGNILEVYNVWVSINRLVTNLNYVQDPATKAEVSGYIKATLDKYTADAILNSLSKIKEYQKYDGGFSHYVDRGTPTHSGLPVSTGANQSDNDATSCALSTFHQMFNSLSLTEYEPTIYQESDWMRFLSILFEQSSVIKYDYDSGPAEPVINYDETPYSNIVSIVGNDDVTNTYDFIVEDDENGVLQINKRATGSNMSLKHSKTINQAGANVLRFEMDIRIDHISNGSNMELYLRSTNNSGPYSPVFVLFKAVTDSNGQGDIMIQDYGHSNAGSFVYAFSTGKWTNFAIEYRTGEIGSDGKPTKAEYRVYVNDKLILVSNRIYGKNLVPNGGLTSLPSPDKMESMTLLFNYNNKSSVCIDNTLLHKLYIADDEGIGYSPEIDDGSGDSGPSPVIETFDEMPGKLTTTLVDGVTANIVDKGEGNKALLVDKGAEGSIDVKYGNVNVAEKNATVAVINLNLLVENLEVADAIEIYIVAGGNYVYLPYLTFSGDSIVFRHNAEKEFGMHEIGKVGEWISLTFKYYAPTGAEAAKYELYADGDLIATCSGTWKGAEAPAVKDVDAVKVLICKRNVGDFYIDNVSIRHLDGVDDDYFIGNTDSAPEASKIETFDTMPQKLVSNMIDGVTADIVDKGDGNKALLIDKTVSGDGKTVGFTYNNVNYKDENANVAVFGFDLLAENVEAVDSLEIYPGVGGTKMFLAYLTLLGKDNGSDIIYRHNTAGDKYVVGKVGEWISIQIRVYDNKLELIVGETLVETFEGTWNNATAEAATAYDNLRITVCKGNQGDFYFDNLYVHHVYDSELGGGGSGDSGDGGGDNSEEGGNDSGSTPQIPVLPEGPAQPDEGFGGYTFEDGKMPEGITASCNLPDNTISIVENGDGSKSILISKPVSGIIDGKYSTISLGLKPEAFNEVSETANATVIAFDMLYTDVEAKGSIELWLRDKDGAEKGIAYFTVTNTAQGSSITMQDLRNASLGTVDSGIVVGTWASVKFIVDGTDGSWDFYVNGELKFSGLATPDKTPAIISNISFSLDKNNSAKCYIDNIYYAQVNMADIAE